MVPSGDGGSPKATGRAQGARGNGLTSRTRPVRRPLPAEVADGCGQAADPQDDRHDLQGDVRETDVRAVGCGLLVEGLRELPEAAAAGTRRMASEQREEQRGGPQDTQDDGGRQDSRSAAP